jgi:tripartite-type tricarboxylate transporter receptor subunit TctC
MVHVPYRSGAQALVDLLGGQVQIFFSSLPSSIAYVRAGNLRALGVTTAWRSEALPDVPSINDSSGVTSLGAPKNTPSEIVEILHHERTHDSCTAT